MRIGFLGVGTISTAVIHAMADREHELFLSPRSAALSAELAATYPKCTRLDSNQAVVDQADIVVVAVRPPEVVDVLTDLRFRPDQIIVSFIGGLAPSRMVPLVAPATRVCQVVPLPPIAVRKGPILIGPPFPEVVSMFDGLGDIICFDDEDQMLTLSVASAILSTFFEWQNTVIGWVADSGIDADVASVYVRSLLEGLATTSRATPLDEVAQLPQEYQTRGGLNERVRGFLLDAGWFAEMRNALDLIRDRIQGK